MKNVGHHTKPRFKFLCFFLFTFVTFLGMTALSSCGRQPPEGQSPLSVTTSCIIGGLPTNSPSECDPEKKTDSWRNAVALTNKTAGRYFCSGVLIHPRLVLTAAHCLPSKQDQLETFIQETFVYVGPGAEGGHFIGQFPILEAKAHPQYVHSLARRPDIAYLLLKDPVEGIPITPILENPDEILSTLLKKEKVTLVGFGKRASSNKAPEGVKYQVRAALIDYHSEEVFVGEQGKDTCEGDSGGPVFTQGSGSEWRLLAITSRGPKLCGPGPKNPGIYSLFPKALCFIPQKIRKGIRGLDEENCFPFFPSEYDNFLNYCQNQKTLNLQQRHTTSVLLQMAGETDCYKAFARLKTVTTLNLDHKFLSDLRPLKGLDQLEEISLIDNDLTNLYPLGDLPNLKKVNLDLNSLIDPQQMASIEREKNKTLFSFSQDTLTEFSSRASLDLLQFTWKRVENAESNFTDGEGLSPLMAAVYRDDTQIVHFLISKAGEAPLSLTSPPLLHLARSAPVINILLKYDHSLLSQRESLEGKTALMNAAEEGLSTVVESLCLFGAQASLKDIKGRTAMDLALSRKHWKIYEYLKYNCLNTQ